MPPEARPLRRHHRSAPGILPCLLAAGLSAGCGEPDAGAGPDDDATPTGDDDAGDDDSAWSPDLACPGDPSGICAQTGEAALRAGAAATEITPHLWESWTDADGDGSYARSDGDTFLDCGTDRICPVACAYGDGTSVTFEPSPAWTGPDADGSECNQSFEAVWIAGFGNGRAMNGVHDDLWARGIVLSQGETTLGIVSLDLVGYFYNEVQEVRERARTELGIDSVFVSSTHNHNSPDTMGIWGRAITESGIDPDYMDLVQDRILQVLADAQAGLRPVEVTFAARVIEDDEVFGKGINNFNIDSRDPSVVDKTVRALRFADAGSGDTVATLVNWSNHPEALGSENLLLTSDFSDSLRRTVEEGVDTPEGRVEGVGGVAVFVNGMVGGLMTPLHCDTSTLFGEVYSEHSFEKSDAIGEFIGWYALQALAGEQARHEAAPPLAFRTSTLYLPVENWTYQLAFNAGLFDRPAYDFDPDRPVGDDNMGNLLTEVSYLELGPARVLGIPGELLPEFFLGGYDGSLTGPLADLVSADNPNPPPLDRAPPPPYLADLMGGDFPMVFGLANDEIGYIIPEFQYELGNPPYVSQADGDHYEETNSVGPSAAPALIAAAERLITWTP